MKKLISIIILSLLLPSLAAADDDAWKHTQGTLHHSAIQEWLDASRNNELATISDFLLAVYNEQPLPAALKFSNMAELDIAILKLAICTKMTGEKLPRNKRVRVKTSVIAALCVQQFYSLDSK
jgi:hypothetical protein